MSQAEPVETTHGQVDASSDADVSLRAEGVPALLRVEGLVKRYGGVVATDQVSFELHRGETLGVIGPNGAGKSTLIGLLGGALTASAGRIVFEGADITGWAAPVRARHGIGRTYQIPRPFLDMTVRENLLAAHLSLRPWDRGAAARATCDAILERCGLADAADLPGRQLPLLRRKRLEVARALALGPKLLLLDEVGAGLVDAEVTELIDLVRSLRGEVQGLIVIEHVMRVVQACCDRLLVLDFGRKIAEGRTAEVMASDAVAAIYLGHPHAAKAAVPHGVAATPQQGTATRVPASALAALVGSPASAPDPASSAPGAAPVLELSGIRAGYGQARVLEGIDLRVAAGRVVAILGTNGAGKTTLASVIAGTIRPTSGTMKVDGIDVTGDPPHRIARSGLAHCMEGRRIFAPLTVEENLLLPARGVPAEERADRLMRVYSLFPELATRRLHGGTSMSGGQQQMLAIGRALMARPRLVVFDEISLGLAPIVMDRLYTALAELRAAGLTMLIVEQDVERALALADEVHVMEHGRIALSGSPAAIRDDARLRQIYIGTA